MTKASVILLFPLFLAAQPDKMVFVRDSQMLVARGDGSGLHLLVTDPAPRAHPKWSPDGTRIVSQLPGTQAGDPKTHAILEVVTASSPARTVPVPVYSSEKDGTPILGMRFVEEIGWCSNQEIYALGSANPTSSEIRVLTIDPLGTVQSDLEGERFSVCPASGTKDGSVVNLSFLPHFTDETRMSMELNGKRLYPKAGSLSIDTVLSDSLWLAACSEIAFVQRQSYGTEVVVVKLDGTARSYPIAFTPTSILTIAAAPAILILKNNDSVRALDLSSGKFLMELTGSVKQSWDAAQRRIDSRAFVARKLGVMASADWWPRLVDEATVRRESVRRNDGY